MANLMRPAVISGVSAGSFPETAAGNEPTTQDEMAKSETDKFQKTDRLCNFFSGGGGGVGKGVKRGVSLCK